MKKLALVTTHPIQYNAPWFNKLSRNQKVDLKVFYTWSQAQGGKIFDPDFNKVFKWDIPLMEGYKYTFVNNVASNPGSHHFFGIDNPTLTSEIASWKPDAVMVIGWSFKSHLKCLAHFKNKVPVFFRGDSTLIDQSPGFSIKKIARKVFLKYVYSKVDYAFYVGKHNKDYFLQFGMHDDQCIYAPHAIDVQRFTMETETNECKARQLRKQLGIKDDSVVFLFAGKLEPKKNPGFLLQQFLDANIKNSHLVFVGNGKLEKELKAQAEEAVNIHFIPFQNQSAMPVIYRMGDVFVLPSQGPGETWGLAMNEAMACGRAVIASSKCGGAIDLIDDGKGGFIFNPAVDHELKARMKQSSDVTVVRRMGQYNLQKIADFNFCKIVNAIEMQMNKL